MKIISRQHNKRKRQKTLRQLILALLFVVFVGFLNITDRNPLSGAAHFITIPLVKAESAVSQEIRDFVSIFRSKKALIRENNDLKQELLGQENLLLINKALREENEELLHFLGRDIAGDHILATVLSKPGTSPYDTILLDIGAEDGVHVGDQIIANGDFLVGFVSKVFARSSQATFFSSPGEKTNILIGSNDIQAVALGRGAGNFSAELPRDVEISLGDTIVLGNLETQIFGEVESIVKEEVDAFQLILFKSPVNVFSLKKVQVIRSNNRP